MAHGKAELLEFTLASLHSTMRSWYTIDDEEGPRAALPIVMNLRPCGRGVQTIRSTPKRTT